MRKLIMFFVLAGVLASCSKDDDTPPPVEKTPSDYLVEGSPWKFSAVELLRINYNPNELTIAEASQLFTETFTNLTFAFSANGTGSATMPDNSSYSYNWKLNTNKQLELTGMAPATFHDVSVTATNFYFTGMDYCVDDLKGDDVCADVRFTFK